jgi:hypothetical protein
MSGSGSSSDDAGVQRYRIHHRHERDECGPAQAAWRGSTSPLRSEPAVSSCEFGGHEIWWDVDGSSEAEVLGLLPPFVAERSTATRTGWLVIRRPPATQPKENNQP